jgi:hypothetical protein
MGLGLNGSLVNYNSICHSDSLHNWYRTLIQQRTFLINGMMNICDETECHCCGNNKGSFCAE